MSTWFFDYIAELIRARLAGSISDATLTEIYHPKDEAFLNIIAVDGQPTDVFNSFYVATLEARVQDTKFRDHALWDEILRKLRADPRWDPAHSC